MLGMLLREGRLSSGLSQRQLAERLGTSQRYIVELEQGKPVKAVERLFAYLQETGITLHADIADEHG
ncbi:helix-turn-helix domain-containing protein [Microbacterium sp. PMB16]|uniref:helix-turn-helix domain-containing protein n=1 Tax=Microbacterium sp. PMB16 TaxID=3120157 RepID=UPI003F4BB042